MAGGFIWEIPFETQHISYLSEALGQTKEEVSGFIPF